jgi:predicted PurR-regulated permease PerM
MMSSTLRNILIVCGVLLLLACAWYFRSIVVYILVSGVLSIMGRPLVDLLCRIRIKKLTFPRTLAALITLLIIWGVIILFFYIFIPLVTTQLNYFSTIDSEKIVRLVEAPIARVEQLFRFFNKDISDQISIQDYIVAKVSGVLNADLIQNFLGSIFGIMGNVIVAIFSNFSS